MRRLLIILTLICSVSCVTQRRCYEKFPPQDTTITWHDTVYFVSLETDTVHSVSYITDTVYASTGTAGGSAWVINDTIYLNVWQKDTIIEYRDSVATVISTQYVDVPCKKTPVLTRLIWLVGLIVVLVLVLRFARVRGRV